ncbi:flagellar type III secretion system pore protein FliP [Curtobacterium sp. MCBD17_040]|uniref:flagellar type III secretion system pore protein FliP n=1 Tax=Curtobacterium sp. MCBD17_040 TaxID=2175674 RepID=UPI000DAA5B5D|nr:flagellar type III secretion system pore protein FliP [Curtobacterium sp. MCBD17_040]WIB65589.1 flagellar type III secretion system pore protein FliP [Curtobacterium sp. MCBD17_040]
MSVTVTPADLRAERRIRYSRWAACALLVAVAAVAIVLFTGSGAHAATLPTGPTAPATPAAGTGTISINGPNGAPSSAIVTMLGITVLSIAPALLLMMSSFTKVFVVLAMVRNATGLNTLPPNQVLAGMALFLSIFIMHPVLGAINTEAVQPYLAGHIDFGSAMTAAETPLAHFMGAHTRQEDIALITRAAGQHNPKNLASVPCTTLVPAFMLSELRAAFVIGFVVFIPFLVIDLVVSASLMSMGMMMLPPSMISLPFKVLLFVLVDGWGLVIQTLVTSYK